MHEEKYNSGLISIQEGEQKVHERRKDIPTYDLPAVHKMFLLFMLLDCIHNHLYSDHD